MDIRAEDIRDVVLQLEAYEMERRKELEDFSLLYSRSRESETYFSNQLEYICGEALSYCDVLIDVVDQLGFCPIKWRCLLFESERMRDCFPD